MGTTCLAFRSSDMGPYPYDTYASSLNLENRWRLNSVFSAEGATEASIGTLATNIVRGTSTINRVAGLTKGTADSYGQQTASSASTATKFWASTGVPATFTIGLWYQPRVTGSDHLFGVGASPDYQNVGYHGMWLDVVDGVVRVQFGDGSGYSSASRYTYYTSTAVVPNTGPAFIVVCGAKALTTASISFNVYVNGSSVSCPYQSGSGTTIAWGDRITIGSGYWGTSLNLTQAMDEPFMTAGHLSGTQILQMYQYGVTP